MTAVSVWRAGRAASTLGVISLVLVLLAPSPAQSSAEPDIRPWSDDAAPLASHLETDAWTLVMLWSVTCSICAAETPGLSAFHTRAQDVRLLGVSIDGPAQRAQVARWMRDHGMAFPTLLGTLSEVSAYFARAAQETFRGTPTFLLFDPRGKLVGVNAGPVRVEAVERFIARKSNTQHD